MGGKRDKEICLPGIFFNEAIGRWVFSTERDKGSPRGQGGAAAGVSGPDSASCGCSLGTRCRLSEQKGIPGKMGRKVLGPQLYSSPESGG